jgi:hypothetical protein
VNVAKRNHYNPCFWTAHWNPDYYARALASDPTPLPARSQPVHALSVKSGKLFPTTVENIHYDKHLGFAEITREASEGFAKRWRPDTYQDFLRDNTDALYPVFIDFEDILVALEGLPPYTVLRDVIKNRDIQSVQEKAFLGSFVFLQLLRSHAIMNATIQWHAQHDRHKFEHFVTLKWMLSDADSLHAVVAPLVYCHWTLFVAHRPVFPLCDSAILVKPDSIMVALSPMLLLEIRPAIPAGADQWHLDDAITPAKLDEFRRRTIGNTFREIIGPPDILHAWQASPEFEARMTLLKDVRSYNRMVAKRGEEEVWVFNAFGNHG